MTTDLLESQIRSYTLAVDRAAPPLEELLPTGMAEELGMERQPSIEVRLSRRRSRRRLAPIWVAAATAAVVTLAFTLPALLWLTGGDDTAETTTTAPRETSTSVPTVPQRSNGLVFDLSSWTLRGAGWTPGREVEATYDGDPDTRTAFVEDDGTFVIPGPTVCCTPTGVSVSDGRTLVDGIVDWKVVVERVDAVADVVAGMVGPGYGDATIRIVQGGTVVYEAAIEPPGPRGSWLLDLDGVVDITAETTVTATVDDGAITVQHTVGAVLAPALVVDLSAGRITGSGWSPNASIDFTLDSASTGLQAFADIGGAFTVSYDPVTAGLSAGAVLRATDGTTRLRAEIPLLTVEEFDPQAGVARGTTSTPPQSTLRVFVATTGGTNRSIETQPRDGIWSVGFDPLPPGEAVAEAYVGVTVADVIFRTRLR